jgi:RimJ/RimL family protein N-acetyltransferase
MLVTDDRVARFVSQQLGYALCPPFVCLGIERDGEVVAGAILNHFEGADVHLTAAGKGWTRAFLRALGTYVFDQLGCERMTAVTRQDAVVALATRLGMQVEGRLRNHFGAGHDGIVLGVLREEYRY